MGAALIDETGNVYGALKVIKSVREPGMRKTMWLCECSCGKQKIFNGSELRAGKRTSCGNRCNNYIDETGNKYGFLKVIKKDPTPALDFPDKSIHWICKCELCESICSISGRNLRNNNTQSCGCKKSLGEQYILKFLNSNNYDYKKEYSFPDLIGQTNKLRFDFAILDKETKNLKYLIEFQGSQHLESNHFLGGEKEFQLRKKYDIKKEKYCKDNKIFLLKIIIPKNTKTYHINYSQVEDIIIQYEKELKGGKNEQISSKYLRSI